LTVIKWKRIISMLLFCIAALGVTLACSVSGNVPFLAQAEPTATQRTTRVARATFTPRPQATNTPRAKPTKEPTEEPTVEASPVPVTEAAPPTKKPAPKPTNPPAPPTNPPPTAPPPPTTNPYRYSFVKSTCEHSGGVHVFVVVYADYKNPNSQLAGARVIASYAPDSPAFGETVGETNSDGAFDYVMSPDGAAPYKGTVYAWVVDKNNTRISEIGGPLELNGKSEDAPDTCWIAKFYFAGGK
jgi:outer membrane biosynthesis protein TonB